METATFLPTSIDVYDHPDVDWLRHRLAARPVHEGERFVGVAPVFDSHHVLVGHDATWVLGPAETDPHVVAGTFRMPLSVRRKLSRLRRVRDFDRAFIAHEVPPSRAPADPGTAFAVSPQEADFLVGPSRRFEREERRAAHAARAAGLLRDGLAGAVSAMAAAASTLQHLDPAICGVVTATETAEAGTLGAWFLLAEWVE